MSGFLHGIRAVEKLAGPLPIVGQDTAVIGLVGTSSKGPALGKITSQRQIEALYGAVDEADGYTIPRALRAIFLQGGAKVIVSRVQGADAEARTPFTFKAPVGVTSTAPMKITFTKTTTLSLGGEGVVTVFGQRINKKVASQVEIPEKGVVSFPEGASVELAPGVKVVLPEGVSVTATIGEDTSEVDISGLPDDRSYVVPEGVPQTVTFSRSGIMGFVTQAVIEVPSDASLELPSGSKAALVATDEIVVAEPGQVEVSAGVSIDIPLGSICWVVGGAELKFNAKTTVEVPAGTVYRKGQTEQTYGGKTEVSFSSDGTFVAPATRSATGATGSVQAVADSVLRLKEAKNKEGAKPNVIVAPWFSDQKFIADTIKDVCKSIRATAVIDTPNDRKAAFEYRKQFGTSRFYLTYPHALFGGGLGVMPLSPAVAGLIAAVSQESGYWVSPSNHVINGIEQLTDSISWDISDEFSDANELNRHHITTVINQGGFRLWGLNTTASLTGGLDHPTDGKNIFYNVRRTSDGIIDAIVASHFWALDRNVTTAYIALVTESINNYLRDLKAEGAISYGKCYIDPEQNSLAQIEQGNVAFEVDYTPSYPAQTITFTFKIVQDGLRTLFEEA